MIGGLFAGMLNDQLDQRFRSSSEIDSAIGIPILTRVGRVKTSSTMPVVADSSPEGESFRMIRTLLLNDVRSGKLKILSATSPLPGDGKTTILANIAASFAKLNMSVVLVEADMRRPSLSATLRVPPGRLGLSDLLAGTCDLRQALRRIKGTGLHYIVAGQPPANPLTALSSARYSELIGELLERYEVVVVDCPPVQPVSDAMVIASQASGVVYVVRAAFTPAPLANAGLKRITEAGIPVFGVLLNNHDFEHAERYYGEYSGFGKYGYETDLKA